jgi:Tol biopolymer transport system component
LARVLFAIACLLAAAAAAAQVTLTQGTNFGVDVATDGRLAIDLLGRIWIVPEHGGAARAVVDDPLPAQRPRWSPDAQSIVYQSRGESRDVLRLYRFDANGSRTISDGQYFDQHPAWHPSGLRIVYSSDRRDSGFDLWELDLPTGLTWRISSQAGDETEPAWSYDGRDLVYIHRLGDRWSLMLRRLGQPDEVLESAASPLSAPSWRPDGSLVTFLRHAPGGLEIDMAILSDPVLVRPLVSGEDFFVAAVAWPDRQQLVYTANGVVRKRPFNSWTSTTIPFHAALVPDAARPAADRPQRRLPSVDPPAGRLVIRTARLFDGASDGYREGLDIVIDGDRIVAVEPRREHGDAIVVDMGDLTALPGYVDSYAVLPAQTEARLGPVLLSYGVTTIVAAHDDAEALNRRWSGKDMPGPRVLGKDWQLDLDSVASAVATADAISVSPAGIHYENAKIARGDAAALIVSGLADSQTRGLRSLLRTRQAGLLGHYPTAIRRFSARPDLEARSASIVLGSKPNGLPPGIALHAEFRALAEAGLDPARVLETAGVTAARALGLGLQIGRIAAGATADIVIVDGDPLQDIDAAVNVVGIVRNGRFFSAIGLLERAETATIVE